MSNNTETVELEAPPTTSINTEAERVYNLYIDLQRTKQQKKDAAAGFRDEIKRIEHEIKDILKAAGEDIGEEIGD